MPPRAARKTASPLTERLRRLPSGGEVLARGRPRAAAARRVLAGLRHEIRRGLAGAELESHLAHLAHEVTAEVRELLGHSLRPVINATGVVLHTNLGRAPPRRQAARRVFELATQYSNL